MSFYPGQHIICIDDTIRMPHLGGSLHGLKRGDIYTVRGTAILGSWHPYFAGIPVVFLVEIVRPIEAGDVSEVGYDVRRFRPLDEKRLDVFRKHLAPLPKKREVA